MTARTRAARAIGAATILLALGPVVTACGADEPTAGCGLSIGYLGATSGRFEADGRDQVGGVRTALAAYNAKHPGCHVRLVVADSRGDEERAPAAARTLIADSSVIGVVGPGFSAEAEATGAAFARAGLTTISPSATRSDLTQHGWDTFFRLVANDDAQGPAAARYLTRIMDASRVFVVDDSETYGTGLAASVIDAIRPRVVGHASIRQGRTDFTTTIARIRRSDADGVFFSGYTGEAALLVRQLRAAGWRGAYEAGDGALEKGFVATAGTAAAEGTVLTAASAPSTLAFTADFEAATNGQRPGLYSGEAADATTIFLDAIAAGRTTRAQVLDYVAAYDGTGITQHIAFDGHGEVAAQTVYAYLVRDGHIQPGWPIQ